MLKDSAVLAGREIAATGHLADVHRHETVMLWSRWQLYAFRLSVCAVALVTIRQAPAQTRYLFFDALRQPVNAILLPFSNATLDLLMAIGGFVIAGDTSFAQNAVPSYATRAALSAGTYLIGFVIVAAMMTSVWSVIDQRRANYSYLYLLVRIYTRWLLGLSTLSYAVVKVIPTQFGFLTPGDLLRPVGQLSRFDMLWTFMSISPSYTVFVGLVELVGALLLFFHRTTFLGALLVGAALTNIAALDLAYDVRGPAIIVCLLLLLDVIVLLPYAPAVLRFLLSSDADEGAVSGKVAASTRWRYSHQAVVVLLALFVATRLYDGVSARRTYYGAGSPIYGLFDVETFVRNGETVTPLANDRTTWKRVGSAGRYDSAGLTVQFANGDVQLFQLIEDLSDRTWTLRQRTDDIAALRYELQPDGSVSLDGRIGPNAVKLRLRPVDPRQFPLLVPRGN